MAIIDKIRKLQALAERAGSEAEAANAAARVQELLLKHNLEIGSIALEQEKGTDVAVDRNFCRVRPHHVTLAMACNRLFDVQHYLMRTKYGYRSSASAFHFIGLSANTEAACVTFSYLCDSVECLVSGWKPEPDETLFWLDSPQSAYRSFRIGASERILEMAEAVKKQCQEHNPGSAELVRIGSDLAWKMFIKMEFKGSYNSDHIPGDYAGYDAGYEQGARVDIHGARSNRMLK